MIFPPKKGQKVLRDLKLGGVVH